MPGHPRHAGTGLSEINRFSIQVPDPFDFNLTVAKPAGWHWATPGEVFEDGSLWTGLSVRDRPVGLRMTADGNVVETRVYGSRTLPGPLLEYLKAEVGSGLGSDEDLDAFYRFARNDPVLSDTVDHLPGMRVGGFDDIFGDVILSILLQMAPMSRSNQMIDAVLRMYGKAIEFNDRSVTLWPLPGDLANADPHVLREKARLGYRAERLVKAARYLALNPVSRKELSLLPEDQAEQVLMKIPGIGPYSAGIILGTLPVDVWSATILSELFLGRTPESPRDAISEVVSVLTDRWGRWRWMAFVYTLNDLPRLAKTYHLSRTT